MRIDVNGTTLWFDVDGPVLIPEDGAWRRRPTVVLLHGGPGSFDHYYLKPDFHRLTDVAQVVYLDLRGHGRSAWGDPADFSYGACAEDVCALCDALGIERPILYGHSMGGFIALVHAIRHPGHAAAIIVDSAGGRMDIPSMVERFRTIGGDRVADVVRRAYGGEEVTREEWLPCWALFGPSLPDRRYGVINAPLNQRYMPMLGTFDVMDQVDRIQCPALIVSGSLDPVMAPEVGRELAQALPAGLGRHEVIEEAGHFPWKDRPEAYWRVVTEFVASVAARSARAGPSARPASGAASRRLP
jgi:pimeloyl-ACP methyl ester carboxylesterase